MAHLRRSPLSFIPLSPSNLRPFGAPPSTGRRECPREPLPLEGAAERSEAGLASFWGGKAASSLPSPLGKGDRAAVDRVLSFILDLRRSPSLFFIPLEPYPARFARHLPHAGKALSVVILFPHMRVFALTMREKRYPRIVAFPIEEGFAGGTVFSFLHPSHAKTTVSYERPFLCVLLA